MNATVKWICIMLAWLLVAAPAAAQMYKWVDKDGKVRYGDTPPLGTKATLMRGAASAASAPAPAGKAAGKGALSPAEQEKEYRQRQEEARKASDKVQQDQQAKSERNEGCERSQEYLRTLESGQRIARSNPNGERYYLTEDQVAQETAKARAAVAKACGK